MSGSLPTAAAIRMFARIQDDRELLLLGLTPGRTGDQLIVPLPVAPGAAYHEVSFPALDLPVDVFDQLDRCFAAGQGSVSLKRPAAPAAAVAAAELELLAPDSSAAHEFRRHRPEVADWALVSVRAPRGATAMFPVAIEFRLRDPQRLFFPTAAVAATGVDLALYFEGFDVLGYRGRVHDFARHPWLPADGSFRGEVATVYSAGLFPCLMTRLCLQSPPGDDTWVADALDGRPIVPSREELGDDRWRAGAAGTAIAGHLSWHDSELRFVANPATWREPIGPEGLEESRFYRDREDGRESFSIVRSAIARMSFDDATRELSVTTADGRNHLFELARPLSLEHQFWIADTVS